MEGGGQIGGGDQVEGGGQGRCERRSEVLVKLKKWGGRVGGRFGGGGGQGGCERRIEDFVKIQKKIEGGGFG